MCEKKTLVCKLEHVDFYSIFQLEQTKMEILASLKICLSYYIADGSFNTISMIDIYKVEKMLRLAL